MDLFQGFVDLEGTLYGSILVTTTADTPINADAVPTFRVYGPNGFVESGASSLKDTGSITAASVASPIVITSTAHGLTTGARVTITGVGGQTGANGTFTITRVNADTFSLDGSTTVGSYTSGGTWNVTGLYGFTITALGVTGYEEGEVYQACFTYAIASVQKGLLATFNVS